MSRFDPGAGAGNDRWIVHKFGGSSVADSTCIAGVASLIETDPGPRVAVVLSACGGVTDSLLELVALAEARSPRYPERLAALEARHTGLGQTLLSNDRAADYAQTIQGDCRDIAGILQTVSLIRSAAQNIRDLVAGYGEIWSTRLFAALLTERARRPGPVLWIDARRAVIVEWGALGPAVHWPASQAALAKLVYLLPPVHRTSEVYNALAKAEPLPWPLIEWYAAYGVACFIAGLVVLRYRRLAIV